MTDRKGKILIADDEETFRISTADLLAREGYQVRQASDAVLAREILNENWADLLIADIKMPGNPNLELIHSIAGREHQVPVILATGYPELHTAVESVNLPVVAYLVKPFQLSDLLSSVARGVRIGQSNRRLSEVRTRLERSRDVLSEQTAVAGELRGLPPTGGVDGFISLTLRHILDSLMDLQYIAQGRLNDESDKPVCRMLECPRLTMAKNAMSEAIATLERTKQSFKSRELADLRGYLESIRSTLET